MIINHLALYKSIVDSLLKRLESKLIGNRDELITINDLLAPKYITIDTTYLVRKIQPKLDEISLLLTQIATFHNDTILSRLVQIREEYILTLKKEWEYFYLSGFSDHPPVLEKLLILYNIEEVVHSLSVDLKTENPEKIYQDYKNHIYTIFHYIRFAKRNSVELSGCCHYSQYYEELLTKHLAPISPRGFFQYAEPFISQIEDPIVSDLDLYFAHKSHEDPKLLKSDDYLYARIIDLACNSGNEKITEKVVDVMLTCKGFNKVDIGVNAVPLTKKSKTKAVLKENIALALNFKRTAEISNSIIASLCIYDADFVDLLLNLVNDTRLSNEDILLLRQAFKALEERPYLTDSQRLSISEYLKK